NANAKLVRAVAITNMPTIARTEVHRPRRASGEKSLSAAAWAARAASRGRMSRPQRRSTAIAARSLIPTASRAPQVIELEEAPAIHRGGLLPEIIGAGRVRLRLAPTPPR